MTSQELDKWMAENVMGWYSSPGTNGLAYFTSHYPWTERQDAFEEYVSDWHPTGSISDAFQVVDKMQEQGYDFYLNTTGKGKAKKATVIFDTDKHQAFSPYGINDEPLAICLAAKKAMEA